MEKLAQDTGIKLTHVPFRGFGPALIGLLRNDVNVLASDIPGALEHVRAGKLRALAVTGARACRCCPASRPSPKWACRTTKGWASSGSWCARGRRAM
jgi:hypothetical protein